ncbi:MAG TPA: hypothetical protein VFN35_22490 [Ktedonobacteraceae bacterium]|nr:hypothetical protein [Ktedonobacteraceae bacterium]
MANLTVGQHNTLVYVVNEETTSGNTTRPGPGTLKRYDVTTGTKTVIVDIPNASIESAQISADGKWILFTDSDGKLRLVRLDGKGLQTLFCGIDAGAPPQWSSDQRHIIFSLSDSSKRLDTVYLLTVATGTLQPLLTVSNDPKTGSSGYGIAIGTWLDNSRVYLTDFQNDLPHDRIYILDTSRGPNQSLSSLPVLVNKTFGDFDSSYDGQRLYVDYGFCEQGGCFAPSSVTSQPATGGVETTLFNEPRYDVIGMRVVTASILLLIIRNDRFFGLSDRSHNGLWKINTNGSGLTRLTSDPTNQHSYQYSSLNTWTQSPWSNVSRDNGLYALQTTQVSTLSADQPADIYTIEYAPLSGGAPTVIASIGDGTTLQIAGWTVM